MGDTFQSPSSAPFDVVMEARGLLNANGISSQHILGRLSQQRRCCTTLEISLHQMNGEPPSFCFDRDHRLLT